MTTYTIKGYITYDDSYGKPVIGFQTWVPSKEYSPNPIVIREHTITVEVPADFDPREEQAKNLEEQKRILSGKFSAAVAEINDKISKLQAINYSQFTGDNNDQEDDIPF